MADKGAERLPCPCTDPKLPQFAWVSTFYQIAGRGKRLLLCTTFAPFFGHVSSPPLPHNSVLKALHTDKGIMTGEECSECAGKGPSGWYNHASIVIATKTTNDVQRALDVVQQQFPTENSMEQFARLLQSKPTIQLSLRNKEYT